MDDMIKLFPQLQPAVDRFRQIVERLAGENDITAAIVGAAYLEELLETLLKTYMIDEKQPVDELLAPMGALGNFAVQVKVAYCLGLLTRDEYDDLKMIAKIRNRFAHDTHTSFQDQSIIDMCANLKQLKQPREANTPLPERWGVTRYVTSIIWIGVPLLARIHLPASKRCHVLEKSSEFGQWP